MNTIPQKSIWTLLTLLTISAGSYSQLQPAMTCEHIGQYNPAGNHFFAYSLLPYSIEWLSPKLSAYQAAVSRFL